MRSNREDAAFFRTFLKKLQYKINYKKWTKLAHIIIWEIKLVDGKSEKAYNARLQNWSVS